MTKSKGTKRIKTLKSENDAFLVELNLLISQNDPNQREPRE